MSYHVTGPGEPVDYYTLNSAVRLAREVTDDEADAHESGAAVSCHVGEWLLGPANTPECFEQVAAVARVATMRRALALAEQHDPELAAELRASLVEAE